MGTKSWNWLAGIVCLAVILCGASSSWAAVRNVCKSGCAYRTIQAGIDDAVNSDTVLVHDGIYVERIDFKGKAITVGSLNGPGATVIDGDKKGNVVTFAGGEGSGSVLRGFAITNGNASYGGGIYCTNSSSPSIANCTISGNSATTNGGGIYCTNSSSPSIADCTISGNSAFAAGGGIACASSSPLVLLLAQVFQDLGGGRVFRGDADRIPRRRHEEDLSAVEGLVRRRAAQCVGAIGNMSGSDHKQRKEGGKL